ncbi:MAG: L-threonylcarbamoyladenylate synthase [Bacteroidota bacterium]
MRAIIDSDIQEAARYLREGEVIAIPTETVYGLAGNALDTQAVSRIFEVKNRPTFNPLIVHSHGLEGIRKFVSQLPKQMEDLADAFWPGPLTLLLPKDEIIPDLVTAQNDRVAVRVPQHPLTLELLASLDFPLAAPSANPFGYISPTTAEHVMQQLGVKIPYILDGGSAQVGVESTIIGWEKDHSFQVYRLGGLSVEQIEEVLGPVAPRSTSSGSVKASGMLKSHYAPGADLFLGHIERLWEEKGGALTAVLNYRHQRPHIPFDQQYVLTPSGNMKEAAQRLFALMREIDGQDYDTILTEHVPNVGLGRAINDRLEKAQAQFKGSLYKEEASSEIVD